MIRLSDVWEPTVYGSYTAINNPMTSAFIRAGIMVNNAALNEIARSGGRTATVPFWQDIDPGLEPNYSNDDPADLAVANKIGHGTMTARKAWLNQGFGEMDLVSELAGASPLQHVRNRFGEYWVRQQNRRLIATCTGIMADNVANDDGDMVVDISGEVGAAGVFGANAFIDAAYTAGENADSFTGIAVHSMIEARMLKNDELESVKDSEGNLIMRTYKGRAVIVDDSLPVSGTGDARVYTSILFGRGSIGFGSVDGNAFALGEGTPKVAQELIRTPEAGNGGGMESIWERKTWIIHPQGFEWTEPTGADTLVEMSPTLADLRKAVAWNRVVDRRQAALAFVVARAV
jgi:hypothetical protein